MSGRFFLDTNIFVYSFDAGAPKKAAQATKLIRRGIDTRGGIVSYQVVQEFFNVALRRFAKPMSSQNSICRPRFVHSWRCIPRRLVWRSTADWSQVSVGLVRFADCRLSDRRSV